MDTIFKFNNIFKPVIWGGRRIAEFKGLPPQGDNIGECWELSPVPGYESVVVDGDFKGMTLPRLIDLHGDEIMGRRLMKQLGGKFPIVVKIIDSADDLSIQVHPDDELAAERHGTPGKTEIWYSIAPETGACLYSGFSEHLTAETLRKRIADNTIVEALVRFETKPGDVFFLPAGRVHSMGSGNLILEVHQASDITYRIYDYDRRDKNGKPRQLHIDEAIEAIDFDDVKSKDIHACNVDVRAGEMAELKHCPYFNVDLMGVGGSLNIDLSDRDSFTVLFAVDGDFALETAGGAGAVLRRGETALVPADVKAVTASGNGKIISIFVP